MDSLEEQLAQLKLLNCRPLSPRIAANNSEIYDRNESPIGKKVGPAVPPKPIKNRLPKVPQSMIIQNACEPLYSKRLQIENQHVPSSSISSSSSSTSSASSTSSSTTKNLNPNKNLFTSDSIITNSTNKRNLLPILHRKQPAYAQQHHIYSNIKMTLDNPAILDQQLEALEYRKKQLERKGLMPSSKVSSTKISNGPKLSSASYVNGEIAAAAAAASTPTRSSPSVAMMTILLEQQQQQQQQQSKIYTNVSLSKLNEQKQPDIVYSNIMHHKQQQQFKNKSKPENLDLVYNNIEMNLGDELPPPPPPTLNTATLNDEDCLKCIDHQQQNIMNSDDDELPPPPSPVSSSYSELRRATDHNYPQMPLYPTTQNYQSLNGVVSNSNNKELNGDCGNNLLSVANTVVGNDNHSTYMNALYNNDYSTYAGPSSQSFSQSSATSDYYGYGSISQGSLTYDSIYEPINPRPPSQLSSRSNYSLYTSYVNGPQNVDNQMMDAGAGSSATVGSKTNGKNRKEAEVEALTDLLVHSMDSNNDVDSYGVCVKCGERVIGENSGCTAMDQIYHIACFTCHQCQINLQGKPFYSLEMQPYCEEDYLNTLEKCSVCMKPILERILRATGKPYHPQCFTCVVCFKSLDGVPFTVDATNQNYCIQDFHKKFAPRCCVCRQPIMPELGQDETVRVVALDRSFHFECYKCEDCGLLLSSEAEGRGCYPLDDHVLCKSCNAKRVQALTNRMTTEL